MLLKSVKCSNVYLYSPTFRMAEGQADSKSKITPQIGTQSQQQPSNVSMAQVTSQLVEYDPVVGVETIFHAENLCCIVYIILI